MSRAKKFLEDMFGEFEDMSELVDAAIDRVDLVGKAANGHRFILAKSEHNNLIPADVVRGFITKANEETMSETEVAKEDLDANVILAEPTEAAEGDATVPGSPAWEAVDAATAAKWTAILARAKSAVWEMKHREKAEAEAGEDNDDEIDGLHDACEAIEFAISILAPFAVNEKAESERVMETEILTKADAEIIIKAGRSLSGANEAALRNAVEAIAKVLDSLPKAPVSPVEGETNLGAETEKPEPVKAEEPTVKKDRLSEIVEEAAELAKADMSGVSDDELARVALTGADGDRTAALQEIGLRALTAHMKHEAAETPAVEEAEEAADIAESAEDATAEAELEAAPEESVELVEETPADEEPAPADEVGVPADDTMKKEKSRSLKKEAKAKKVEKLVKEARDEESEKFIAIIKGLEDRIATLEAPAPSRVLANGALPPEHLMRGQDAGAPKFGNAATLRKQMEDAPDSVTKAEAGEQMRLAALDALTELRLNNR